ncbi:MAG: hypothetical protein AAGF93_10190 [Cyanobacteria bacterium P01_H01_bin.105]
MQGEIGSIYYTLGDYGQAEAAYQAALAEAKSLGYWDTSISQWFGLCLFTAAGL